MSILSTIEETRLVPVAVIPEESMALPLAEALINAGLPQIEVTLRTPCALQAMKSIRAEFPDMIVGAGTILDASIIEELVELGIAFGVSPGLNPNVIAEAQKHNFQMVPGVITPSEVEKAMSLGLKLLKFFPAEAAGGAKMLKALAGPYSHTGVKFIPTGGINAEKAKDYFELPITAAVGGSWFVDKSLVQNRDFKKIEQLTREALLLAK